MYFWHKIDVIKAKSDGLFRDEYQIILFFDYIVASLEKEYLNRADKSNYFSADDINVIMSGGIKAYAELENNNIPNSKVRLENIYFGLENLNEPTMKVIDSKLFPDPSNI